MAGVRKTNAQVVSNIMNYSQYGAMSQAFVMNALLTSAEAVVAGGAEAMPKGSFISPEVWVGVATEIRDKIQAHFGEVAK